MDVETFLKETRGSVANLITMKNSRIWIWQRCKQPAWIQFKVEIKGEDGSIIKVNETRKTFNSQMTEVFQGSDLGEIIEEMFTHMKTQVNNPALSNSRFVFD